MLKKIEKFFEAAMMNSRYAILVAVIFGIVSTLIMIVLGSYNVIVSVQKLFLLFANYAQLDELEKEMVTHIISAVDAYLIATVLIIFSIGLYELFISKIAIPDADRLGSRVLLIHDLDQLKEKLAKVIIIVLIVTFFKYALEMNYQRVLDLFFLSGGVLMIALSVYFIGQKK